MKYIIYLALTITSMMTSPLILAEQKIDVGIYEVHYIGLNTAFLTEEVARAYQIIRSKNKGFLSISILKKQNNALSKPVEAKVTGTMTNLLGQSKKIEFRAINEPNAWYQIATFDFDRRDLYRIQLRVTPLNSPTFKAQFKQRFYAE